MSIPDAKSSVMRVRVFPYPFADLPSSILLISPEAHTWRSSRGMSSDMAENAVMPYAMTTLPPCLSASVPPRSCVPKISEIKLVSVR